MSLVSIVCCVLKKFGCLKTVATYMELMVQMLMGVSFCVQCFAYLLIRLLALFLPSKYLENSDCFLICEKSMRLSISLASIMHDCVVRF